jgi:uncharacterized protein (TIGR02147 family)
MKAGFSSPNFLKLVIEGKRNISNKSILKFAAFFKLNKEETEFFENLVLMNQSSNSEQKKYYYGKLSSLTGYIKKKLLEKQQYEYLSNWYNIVVRELICLCNKKFNPEKICKLLIPSITKKELYDSITLLENLNLIKKINKYEWKQNDPIISTGAEVSYISTINYHKEMLRLATLSLDNTSHTERDISSISVFISKKYIDKYKKLLYDFQDQLLKLANEEQNREKMVQINFQMFPLTQSIDHYDKKK